MATAVFDDTTEMMRSVVWATQRLRSIHREIDGAEDEELLATLMPWAFGPKSILPTVQALVVRAETTGQPVAVWNVYNILTILRTLDGGSLGQQIDIGLAFVDRPALPDDPLAWLRAQLAAGAR